MLTNDKIEELRVMAEQNEGRCTTCNRVLSIYRYKVNRSMVAFLRAAAKSVKDSGKNDFDASTLGIAYSVRTQSSKIRQHGLIARVKGPDGTQLPSRWLITRKGWDFLSGEAIPAKVIVFENQVIGHDGGAISINEITGEPMVADSTPITPPESRVYSQMREPKKHMTMRAEYRGHAYGGGPLNANEVYDLEVERLQIGKPVKLLKPVQREYRDIASFHKEWKITK